MRYLKTKRCIVCGKSAGMWHGYVIAKDKMALGNYVDKKVVAGFCDEHAESSIVDSSGYYGCYDSKLMGECIPLFN